MKKIPFFFVALLLVAIGYFIYPSLKEVFGKNDKVPATMDKSIAVLPFVSINHDSTQDYLSDGLAEGIINSLAQLKDLKVTSRTSSFRFKGKEVDIREAGKLLGVHTVLEGSYQSEGNRIRITAQLINVEDGFHFWSEQYDENSDDILFVQNKISRAIAEKLQVSLLGNEYKNTSKKHSPGKEAYELYVKGRSSWNLRTTSELVKGISFFQQAIELDSLYAAAYSGLADCYTALGYGSFLAPKEAFQKALDAATKSLELDPTLAEPHASLGYYRFYHDWDWAATEEEFRKAIALNPNYEIAYDWYGVYLTSMQRYDEAIVILRKAEELDPFSAVISTDKGFSFYYSGDYEAARKQLQNSLELNPSLPLSHIWLGRVHQANMMYSQSIAEYSNALKVTGDWPVALAQIGNVYGVSGNRNEAEKILDALKMLSAKKYVTPYGVALVYVGLGEKEEALQWLNKAYEEKSHWLVWLKSDPRWDSIRSDKRFAELVFKVGLPN